MKITKEFIEKISVGNIGSLTDRQKKFLEINGYPAKRGWVKNIIGKNLPDNVCDQLVKFKLIKSISHSYIKETLERELDSMEKVSGEKYTGRMAEFRHALYKTVDFCNYIKDCKWEFDYKNEITTCTLITEHFDAVCKYDPKAEENSRLFVSRIQTVEHDGDVMDVSTAANTIACNDLPELIKSWQPKPKVVIKKKS